MNTLIELAPGYIRTISGQPFWPLQSERGAIRIEEIAHALGNICRFTGHTSEFYSVAQHSVLVARILPPGLQLWGLLHDAAEAYLCDLASPVKSQCPGYKAAEERLEQRIANEFGLPWPMPPEVKIADEILFETERRDLMPYFVERSFDVKPLTTRIIPWVPAHARRVFLSAFDDICRRCGRG